MTRIIDGKATAADIRREVAVDVAALHASHGIQAHLALLLVGDDPASQVYVRNKGKACDEVGMRSTIIRHPADVSAEVVLAQVQASMVSSYSYHFQSTSTKNRSSWPSTPRRTSTAFIR
jgi:5,10-methylene-tetrahydrofolate dehydrogenase/methenyl tetrahydrofolate cyclohydrolase